MVTAWSRWATGLLFPAFPFPLPHVSGRSGRSGNKRPRTCLENLDRKDAGRFAQGRRWAASRLHRPHPPERHPKRALPRYPGRFLVRLGGGWRHHQRDQPSLRPAGDSAFVETDGSLRSDDLGAYPPYSNPNSLGPGPRGRELRTWAYRATRQLSYPLGHPTSGASLAGGDRWPPPRPTP